MQEFPEIEVEAPNSPSIHCGFLPLLLSAEIMQQLAADIVTLRCKVMSMHCGMDVVTGRARPLVSLCLQCCPCHSPTYA